MRFDRTFELTVTVPGQTITIRPPIRISFSADKSIRGGLNKMQAQLYNLTEAHRLALVKDAEEVKRFPLSLAVGYRGAIELVFKGTVHTGSNSRQGPDLVTTLECLDGGFDFLNSYTSRTVEGSRQALDAALSDMPNTAPGKITARPALTRPKVLVGNSARLIDDMIGPDETWYIDNEQLFVIKDDEVTASFIPVVSPATGLISTPTRENSVVTFSTLMNPAIKIGQRVDLRSTTAPHLDGVYRVETISYSGDNYGSDWGQTCTCLLAPGVTVL